MARTGRPARERSPGRRVEGRQADAGKVEPVDRLVGDATDTSGDEDACVQDGVGGKRCLRTRALETEPAVGTVARDAGELLGGVDRTVETRTLEIRDVRVADLPDDAAV